MRMAVCSKCQNIVKELWEKCWNLEQELTEKDQCIHKLKAEKTMMENDLKELRSKWFSHKKKKQDLEL